MDLDQEQKPHSHSQYSVYIYMAYYKSIVFIHIAVSNAYAE